MKIEAEGQELVLTNKNRDTAIIPKHLRQKALTMLKHNDHAGLDELISDLPYVEDYAEDGTIVPNEVKAQIGTAAKEKAKAPDIKKEEPDGFIEHSLKQAFPGVTAGIKLAKKQISKNLADNMNPYSYTNMVPRFLKNGILDMKDPQREELESKASGPVTEMSMPEDAMYARNRLDLYNVYNNRPQKYNTIFPAKDRPSKESDPNKPLYSVDDPDYINKNTELIPKYKERLYEIAKFKDRYKLADKDIAKYQEDFSKYTGYTMDREGTTAQGGQEDVPEKEKIEIFKEMSKNFPGITRKQFDKVANELSKGKFNPNTGGISPEVFGNVMANHFITLGKDDKGEFWSYYDKWDMSPTGVDTNWGNAPELYGKTYYKKTPLGLSKSYLTDKEFNEFDFSNKKADLEGLQKELIYKGYFKEDIGKDRLRPYKVRPIEELKSTYESYKNKQIEYEEGKKSDIKLQELRKKGPPK